MLLIKRKILEITIRISFAFYVVVVIVVVVYQIQFANFVKKMQSVNLSMRTNTCKQTYLN